MDVVQCICCVLWSSVSYVRNHSLTHGDFPERDLCRSYEALLATLSGVIEQDGQRVWDPTDSARFHLGEPGPGTSLSFPGKMGSW